MNWLVWLGLAVLVAGIAAVTGMKPKGTRHVSHTRMMGVGRVVLIVIIAIFAYLAYRARGG
jgi:F0F1-type ATP synthase membrane subunit a